MIELEKTIVAVITNHLQPFVEKVNKMLKMFKELGYTKEDINDNLELFVIYELRKVFYYCITALGIAGIGVIAYVAVASH